MTRYNIDEDDERRERGRLRSGDTLYVPLRFMDSKSNVERDAREGAEGGIWKPSKITASDGRSDRVALSRPGPRYGSGGCDAAEAAGRAADRALCYDAYKLEKSQEFLTGAGSGGFVGSRPGDLCTVRNVAGGDLGFEGDVGHLIRRGNKLVCCADTYRSDAAPNGDEDDEEEQAPRRRRERSVSEAFEQTQNGTEAAGFGNAAMPHDRALNDRQAVEDAHRAYDEWIGQQWKTPL